MSKLKETKKNIVIVGYPKSGTTWLSRLVAELVWCPLKGDWGFDHLQQPYMEGLERDSEYQCYKSHHTYDTIQNVSEKQIHKIIYVIRDPRDIVISGMYFFDFVPQKLQRFIKGLPRGASLYNILKEPLYIMWGTKTRKKQMISAVLYGAISPSKWLKTSWNNHYVGYKNTKVIFIKYEDLIAHTHKEISRIMDYLDIKISEHHLKKSIDKHSFKKQQKLANTSNNEALKKNIRKGSYGYWRKEFTEKEISLFGNEITNDMYDFR